MLKKKFLTFIRRGKTAVKILLYKLMLYIFILLNIPTAIFIILISPIYRIKVGELEMRSIGHCAITMEIFFGELDLNIHEKKSKYIWFVNDDINYWSRKISNKFLLKKWKEKVSIGPRFIFEPLFYIFRFLKKFSIGDKFLIPYRHWLDHSDNKPWQIVDIHNVLEKTSPQIKFNQEEERIGRAYLEKHGLEKEKYICFYSRTSEYRGDDQKSIRDSDIKTQIYGIEKLCREKNLKAVRLGYSPKTKLETNDVIIEYSNSSDRSDFLDFYLGFHCKFTVGAGGSGVLQVPMMNRKKLLAINYADIGAMNHITNSMIPLILPKKIKDNNSNEFINYSNTFRLGLMGGDMLPNNKALNFIDNNEIEISNAIFEMNTLIEEGILINYNDILQNKFKKIFQNHYNFFPSSTKVSSFFLENNKNLLN
jgi:putative glycosyltransferase (TIGR04372 family)